MTRSWKLVTPAAPGTGEAVCRLGSAPIYGQSQAWAPSRHGCWPMRESERVKGQPSSFKEQSCVLQDPPLQR